MQVDDRAIMLIVGPICQILLIRPAPYLEALGV